MRRIARSICLTVFMLIAAPAIAADPPTRPWPFTAPFMGSASCYGGLYVREKTISWLIPFSQCQTVPYKVIEQWGEGNQRNVVFQLTQRQPKCRFNIIYLKHDDNPDFGIGWDVGGFADLAEYRRAKEQNWLYGSSTSQWCYLYVPSK